MRVAPPAVAATGPDGGGGPRDRRRLPLPDRPRPPGALQRAGESRKRSLVHSYSTRCWIGAKWAESTDCTARGTW
jgi:hypothetical protein